MAVALFRWRFQTWNWLHTAAITSREDIARNSPFLISLPLLSLGYRALMLYGVLIHRCNDSPNNGNVAVLFLRHAD
ncbi:MAG: hypothetical protein HKL99_07315 [Burkholderiales bacterium]|jgi:hypothetical protein|nr:hypothetical protein [Burkholderiales bacterium]